MRVTRKETKTLSLPLNLKKSIILIKRCGLMLSKYIISILKKFRVFNREKKQFILKKSVGQPASLGSCLRATPVMLIPLISGL